MVKVIVHDIDVKDDVPVYHLSIENNSDTSLTDYTRGYTIPAHESLTLSHDDVYTDSSYELNIGLFDVQDESVEVIEIHTSFNRDGTIEKEVNVIVG